jgi:hypothetical protein
VESVEYGDRDGGEKVELGSIHSHVAFSSRSRLFSRIHYLVLAAPVILLIFGVYSDPAA